MTSNNKGEIAVLKVELEANKKGFLVSYPRHQNARYDMLIDDGETIHRTQVKYLNRKDSHKNNNSLAIYEENPYSSEEINLFLMYIPCRDVVISIPLDKFHNKRNIRINIESSDSPNYYKKFIW